MTHQLFIVSDHNPNDTTGGGGCVCSPAKQTDCKPPFAIFPANDMESIASPHVVICQNCAAAVLAKMDVEVLSAGEDMTPLVIEGEVVEDSGWTDEDFEI